MQKLRKIRVARKLTQPALSQLSGVSISTIWRAEQGGAISEISALRICEALGVSVSDVVEFQTFGPDTGEVPAVSPTQEPHTEEN